MAWNEPDYFTEVYLNNCICKSIFRGYLVFPENTLPISCWRKIGLRGREKEGGGGGEFHSYSRTLAKERVLKRINVFRN